MKVNVAFHFKIKAPESGGRVERLRIQCEISTVRPEHPRESMWYCQEEDHQETSDPTTPQLCHGLISFMPRHTDAVIHTKGALTKY